MLLGDIVNLRDTESFLVRRIIIVPPNIEEEVINEELGYDEDGKEIRHAVPLNKYIKDKETGAKLIQNILKVLILQFLYMKEVLLKSMIHIDFQIRTFMKCLCCY